MSDPEAANYRVNGNGGGGVSEVLGGGVSLIGREFGEREEGSR